MRTQLHRRRTETENHRTHNTNMDTILNIGETKTITRNTHIQNHNHNYETQGEAQWHNRAGHQKQNKEMEITQNDQNNKRDC